MDGNQKAKWVAKNFKRKIMPGVDDIGHVSYLIYLSMRHYVLTIFGDIVAC